MHYNIYNFNSKPTLTVSQHLMRYLYVAFYAVWRHGGDISLNKGYIFIAKNLAGFGGRRKIGDLTDSSVPQDLHSCF